MKVYIASKYIENADINRKIHNILLQAGIQSFLPETINIDAISPEEEKLVGDKCYKELLSSDVILFVSPYGDSVIAEVGAAIASSFIKKKIKVILFGKLRKNEAMLSPYIDVIVDEKLRRDDAAYDALLEQILLLNQPGGVDYE